MEKDILNNCNSCDGDEATGEVKEVEVEGEEKTEGGEVKEEGVEVEEVEEVKEAE